MTGFDYGSRYKTITKRYLFGGGTSGKFGGISELNVLGCGDDYTIHNISALNGVEGYIQRRSNPIEQYWVFIPFDTKIEHRIYYTSNGIPSDYGSGFDYAEIHDDKIWVDYDGCVR